MRYKVIRSCYWDHRLWEKGEEVEVAGDVPEHFQPLTSAAARLAALKAEVDALRAPVQEGAAPAEVPAQEEAAPAQEETAPAQEETAPAEAPMQEEAGEQATSLESMNVGQLQKLARENRLEPPKNATKKELISALRGE